MSIRQRRFVKRLRNRDERAFAELVAEYGDRVISMALRMMGSSEEAEDIAQEVFITVFKSIESFRGDSKLSTWIYRITANLCKNRIKFLARRHDKKNVTLDSPLASDTQVASGHVRQTRRPDQALEANELSKLIQECLLELEESTRALIVLRDIEDLAYDEIAEILDVPAGTIKSRLHRARAVLREKVKKRMERP